MQWVIWDEDINGPSSVMRNLPENLQDFSIEELNKLGYRELLTVQPEDFIPRFVGLAGTTDFELREDGRVYQSYPDADFSVSAVREELKKMAANDASRVLSFTDWYFIRNIENGSAIPDDVRQLREMIREHLDWIRSDIDGRGARELVEYRWTYPSNINQRMINGVPVVYVAGEPVINPTPVTSMEMSNSNSGPFRSVEGVDVPVDVNDIPVVADPYPHISDTSPMVTDPYPALNSDAPVVPEDDIRRLSQEERDSLPKEELERLLKKEDERLAREGK